MKIASRLIYFQSGARSASKCVWGLASEQSNASTIISINVESSKDIQLELPVTIYHSSVLPFATELARANFGSQEPMVQLQAYQPPISPAPYMNLSPSPQPYPLPVTPPPALPFVDNGRVYLPSSSPVPYQHPYYSPYSPFPITPHISPARPSSAEPTPSSPYFITPPGMPTSSVPQPLPTLAGDMVQLPQREEGKGERASRITHHLRMSSRTRSVSPQSHRYTIPHAVGVSLTSDFVATSHSVQHLPTLSRLTESPSMQNLSPDVVSPMPMHSPKHTVTVDPFTYATFNKSERVEVLERAAAEAVEANADMSGSMPALALDADKTLPKPPVPSSKTKPFRNDARPRANMLFPPSQDGQSDQST